MEVKAKLSYLRIAPRKVRMVTALIKGKKVEKAQAILNFTTKKAAQPVLKLLNSALASAINTFQMQESNMYISKVLVNEGPKLKRWRARARGRAFAIQKKTSHITIVLQETEKAPRMKKKKAKKVVTPIKETKKQAEAEKPKFKPKLEIKKPESQRGISKFFRRKSF
jgi:large subunit ribosomal protein L22